MRTAQRKKLEIMKKIVSEKKASMAAKWKKKDDFLLKQHLQGNTTLVDEKNKANNQAPSATENKRSMQLFNGSVLSAMHDLRAEPRTSAPHYEAPCAAKRREQKTSIRNAKQEERVHSTTRTTVKEPACG